MSGTAMRTAKKDLGPHRSCTVLQSSACIPCLCRPEHRDGLGDVRPPYTNIMGPKSQHVEASSVDNDLFARRLVRLPSIHKTNYRV